MKLDVVIVGVGGQGTLLTSRILGQLAIELGVDVKVSEVHGMSQRGGSVITYVRMGEKLASPLIEMGQADFVLAFEQLEAARALPYLKDSGTLIMNTGRISPMPVIVGNVQYPEGIEESLKALADTIALDASGLAAGVGEPRAVNLVLLGVLSKKLNLDEQVWLNAISECVPERFRRTNLKAFEVGVNTI